MSADPLGDMVGMHQRKRIPLEIYHGIPAGWRSEEVVAEHSRLRPTHDLLVPEVTEPGAPPWLPDRKAWLQYRAGLYEIAEGIAVGDLACVELAIRYIELRYIGSYSGFIREKLARRLANAELSAEQKVRLQNHFEKLVLDRERTQEFRAFVKLWRRIITPAGRDEVVARVAREIGTEAAAWLSDQLAPNSNVA